MRIDSHQHYWKIAREDYGWITPKKPLMYRDYMPADLEPLLNKHDMDGSIIVQAAPTVEETEFILSIADQTPSVIGVVGWLDLFQPDHRLHYEQFRCNPKFVGFRIMIQDMQNAYRIMEPSFVEALRGYVEEELPVDLLVNSNQLEPTIELLRQIPGLRGVIDHMAKPLIQSKELEPWSRQMEEISRFPEMYCKLSGMVTEGDHNEWKQEDFIPYIQHIVKCFGPERVMFGSDWPVCLMAASYDEVMEVLLKALPESWGADEYSRLFGRNAKEFYKL